MPAGCPGHWLKQQYSHQHFQSLCEHACAAPLRSSAARTNEAGVWFQFVARSTRGGWTTMTAHLREGPLGGIAACFGALHALPLRIPGCLGLLHAAPQVHQLMLHLSGAVLAACSRSHAGLYTEPCCFGTTHLTHHPASGRVSFGPPLRLSGFPPAAGTARLCLHETQRHRAHQQRAS